MVSIKEGDAPSEWYVGEGIGLALQAIDWRDKYFVAHNAAFDGFIAYHHYGIKPWRYLDTIAIAKAKIPGLASYSLDSVCNALQLGSKVHGVLESTSGVWDWPPELVAAVSEYAVRDTELAYKALQYLLAMDPVGFPDDELGHIHLTTRLFCQPVLELDLELLKKEIDEHREIQTALLEGALKVSSKATSSVLASNKQFAALLTGLGVQVPQKVSPRTGRNIPALSAKDPLFIAMYQSAPTWLKRLLDARVRVKSTINESRALRMISIGETGALPIKLNYCGAHTTRWSGGEKINPQNFPRGGIHRRSIVAPPGYLIASVDSGQIEARITAWLAKDEELLKAFKDMNPESPTDVYTDFASKIYNRPITKADKTERFVGKTCILGLGYGMGAQRLRDTLLSGVEPVDIEFAKCQEIVNTYRGLRPRIRALWSDIEEVFRIMERCGRGSHKWWRCLRVEDQKFALPSGLYMYYPDIKMNKELGTFTYYDKRISLADKPIWGGVLVENVVQALARCVVAQQMAEIDKKYRVVMMTHDEVISIIKEEEAELALQEMVSIMSTPPAWLEHCPLSAEGGYDKCYSK